MPDNVKDEGRGVEEEPRKPPVPAASAGSDDAGSEQQGTDSVALGEILTRLEKKVDSYEERFDKLPDLIDARVKSDKDKEVYRLRRDHEQLKALVEAAGGDFSRIEPRVEREALYDRLDSIEQRLSGSGGVGGSTSAQDAQTPNPLTDYTEEFLLKRQEETGLTLSDEELQELIASRRWPSNPAELKLAWRDAMDGQLLKKAKQGSVSSAAGVGKGGKSPAGPMDDDDLMTEINDLQKHPMKNVERRQELIAEAKRRGIFQ